MCRVARELHDGYYHRMINLETHNPGSRESLCSSWANEASIAASPSYLAHYLMRLCCRKHARIHTRVVYSHCGRHHDPEPTARLAKMPANSLIKRVGAVEAARVAGLVSLRHGITHKPRSAGEHRIRVDASPPRHHMIPRRRLVEESRHDD